MGGGISSGKKTAQEEGDVPVDRRTRLLKQDSLSINRKRHNETIAAVQRKASSISEEESEGDREEEAVAPVPPSVQTSKKSNGRGSLSSSHERDQAEAHRSMSRKASESRGDGLPGVTEDNEYRSGMDSGSQNSNDVQA